MAFAKFQENGFGIAGEIAENHAILVNLPASRLQSRTQLSGSHAFRRFLSQF